MSAKSCTLYHEEHKIGVGNVDYEVTAVVEYQRFFPIVIICVRVGAFIVIPRINCKT